MAFFLNKTSIASHLRSQSHKAEDALSILCRGFHIKPGTREQALLADDSALSRFKSHKKGVNRIKRVGDVLTIALVTGCCYELHVRATMREEARSKANAGGESA